MTTAENLLWLGTQQQSTAKNITKSVIKRKLMLSLTGFRQDSMCDPGKAQRYLVT